MGARHLAITAAPCAHCPFRKDVPIYLRRERREEIADVLTDGGDFPCHSTVEWHEEDDGESYATGGTTCAGAAKAVMLAGGTTQLMRISERLGLADLDRTAESGPEVWSIDDWPRLAEGATAAAPEWEVGDEDGVRTCATVNASCLAPAGYLTASGAVTHGREEADGECTECGDPLCSACADENGRCGTCSDYQEDEA